MKEKQKRFLFRNIRFQGKMLLIYIIGGIVPFIGVCSYTNYEVNRLVLDKTKKKESNELRLISKSLKKSITIAERVGQVIYVNQELRNILSKEYKDRQTAKRDIENQEFIQDTMRDFDEIIEDITIYTSNTSIASVAPFDYLATSNKWYQETISEGGKPYWYVDYDKANKEKGIQMARAIFDGKGSLLGIEVVRINLAGVREALKEKNESSVLEFNDDDTIYRNDEIEHYGKIKEKLKNKSGTRGMVTAESGVQKYLVFYDRVLPQGTGRFMAILSIVDENAMYAPTNRITLVGYIIVGIAILFSISLIFLVSESYGGRLKKLLRQMHFVANGKYDDVEPIEGNDEIAEIYLELEKMMGDIQELLAAAVEEKVQKEKLHTRQKEVEFKMLASQINPHFLYNTLETIRMKARMNHQDEIEELVKMLAKIMRRNIRVRGQMVSLESEIELIENYLKIQSYRFGDRIRSEVVVEKAVNRDVMVMPLIIQPFVENAFVHGLEAVAENGVLQIHIYKEENEIFITVKDNGAGMNYYELANLRYYLNQQETAGNQPPIGIGVSNVNQRLKMKYGEQYGVKIDSQPGEGTIITIHFPEKDNFYGKNV